MTRKLESTQMQYRPIGDSTPKPAIPTVWMILTLMAGAHAASAAVIHVPADQPTIQAGINAAAAGDEVVVAPGTYVEYVNFNGKAITLRSTDPSDPAIVAATILDGHHDGPMVRCTSGEGAATVLSGFLITGGDVSVGGGGGMRIVGSSPTVNQCTFQYNVAIGHGGGMYILNGSPTLNDCTFDHNFGTSRGGGICVENGDAIITNCTFEGNQAGSGAGMYNEDGSPTLTNCQFDGNSTYGTGGGGLETYGFSADPMLTDCGFCFNSPMAIAGSFTNVGNTTSVSFCAAKATGACCLSGACIVATAPDCLGAGGSYAGDDIECAAAGCDGPPPGPVLGDMNDDGLVNGEDIGWFVAALVF